MPSVTTLVRVLTAAVTFLSLALADPPPFTIEDEEEYEKGNHGIYPEIKYKTSDLVSPHVMRRTWNSACENGDYYFVCPRGLLVGHPGPMILDEDGYMVWHTEAWKVAYGLTVQKYRGEDYLTFWSGNDQVIGHGSGFYYMLDKHYNQFRMIEPVGNLTGDLHEFKITPDHTALVTSYLPIPWDLSKLPDGGREGRSWIWDCIFQEIDLETNQLLFEWKATDHFTFADCYNPLRNMGAPNNPWDWFHINSVEKDSRGNYLVSSRYSHSLIYINGKSGDVMWQLGGKNCSFSDLSDGRASNFSWQHDGRWVDEFRQISLFDNAAFFGNQTMPARGLVVNVDLNAMTAKVETEVYHPRNYIAESQGSMQVMKDGRLMVGYGSVSAYTEYDEDGTLQCDMQYGALHFHKNGDFSPSAVMSYRTYKHAWKGYPSENPKVKFDGPRMYVSWNGATELRHWLLEGSVGFGTREKDWKTVELFPRTGFESNVTVDEKAWKVFRLTAYDRDDKILGIWRVYSAGDVQSLPLGANEQFNAIFYVLFGALIALAMNYLLRKRSSLFRLGHRHNHSRSASGSGDYSYDTTDDEYDDEDYTPLTRVAYHNHSREQSATTPVLSRADAELASKLQGGKHTPTLAGEDAEIAAKYLSPQLKQY